MVGMARQPAIFLRKLVSGLHEQSEYCQEGHEYQACPASEVGMGSWAFVMCSRAPDTDDSNDIVGYRYRVTEHQSDKRPVKHDHRQKQYAGCDIDNQTGDDGPCPERFSKRGFTPPQGPLTCGTTPPRSINIAYSRSAWHLK